MESPRSRNVVAPGGFTLVELIIVLFLIVLITFVVITSQSQYNRSLILTNTAYTVALSIREAQSLGLSSRTFNSVQNAGHGVNFNESDMTKYRVFGDVLKTPGAYGGCPQGTVGTPEEKQGNCLYDDDANKTEVLNTFSLNRGFSIKDFCGIRTSNGNLICAATTGTTDWRSMNIVFLRPNTESIMTMISSTGSTVGLNCAIIWIDAPVNGADPKCIVVSQTGQVSVPQSCPTKPITSCP